MKKIPKSFKKYFWDIDFDQLTFQKSKTFILKRILDRGDTKALKWLLQHYTKDDIRNLLLISRDLSQKTANFWAFYLGVNKRKVVCLQKPYLKMRQTHWPY